MNEEQLSLAESFLAEIQRTQLEGFRPNSSDPDSAALDQIILRILASPTFPHKNSLRWYKGRTELQEGDRQQLQTFADLLARRVQETRLHEQRLALRKLPVPSLEDFRTKYSLLSTYLEEIFASSPKAIFVENFHPDSGVKYHREVYDWLLDYAEASGLPCQGQVRDWLSRIQQKVAFEASDRMALLEIFNRLQRTFEKKVASTRPSNGGGEAPSFQRKLLVLDVTLILSSPVSLRDNVIDFLHYLSSMFVFGVWTCQLSSGMLSGLLQELFQRSNISFLFVFGSDRSTVVSKSPSVLRKDLSLVWKMFPAYSEANTLIIDDSPETFFSNPLWCCLLPESFASKEDPLSLEGPLMKLLTYIGGWSQTLKGLYIRRASINIEEFALLEFGFQFVKRFQAEFSKFKEITDGIFAVCPRNQFSTSSAVHDSLQPLIGQLKTWAADYSTGDFLPYKFLAADILANLDSAKHLTANQRVLQLVNALSRIKVKSNC